MSSFSEARIQRTFQAIVDCALAGERCPPNRRLGIESEALAILVQDGLIKIEYSTNNFRRIHILKGEHAGKCTAADPSGNKPFKVVSLQGVHRDPTWTHSRTARPQPSLPKLSFLGDK